MLSSVVFKKTKCGPCSRLSDGQQHSLSAFDPEDVPGCLSELTFVEEMLISINLPMMYICMLTPGGQLGYKSHTTVVQQNTASVAQKLPRAVSSLSANLVTIRKPGAGGKAANCRDFQIRRDVVMNALHWLKENNPYYRGVPICSESSGDLQKYSYFYGNEASDGLATVPAAESVEGAPKTQSTDDGRLVDPDVDTTAGLEGASDADDILEKEKLRKALSDVVSNVSKPNPGKRCREGGHPSDEVISWPTQGNQLVSENEYGIFAKAFPKLVPRGSGDITGAENWKSVTLSTWGGNTSCSTKVGDLPSTHDSGITFLIESIRKRVFRRARLSTSRRWMTSAQWMSCRKYCMVATRRCREDYNFGQGQ